MADMNPICNSQGSCSRCNVALRIGLMLCTNDYSSPLPFVAALWLLGARYNLPHRQLKVACN